jgi:hypothetical protein
MARHVEPQRNRGRTDVLVVNLPQASLAALMTAILVSLSGCGPQQPPAETGPPAGVQSLPQPGPDESADAAAASSSPAELPVVQGVKALQALTQAGVHPTVQSNAKDALNHWSNRDYYSAIVSVRMVMGRPEAVPYAAQVKSAFSEMLEATAKAAAQGEQNAKDAMEYVRSSVGE